LCGWLNARTLGDTEMSLGTIILIILVIALLGGFSGIGGGPFYGTPITAAAVSASSLLFW
jgi:hypothetical protein